MKNIFNKKYQVITNIMEVIGNHYATINILNSQTVYPSNIKKNNNLISLEPPAINEIENLLKFDGIEDNEVRTILWTHISEEMKKWVTFVVDK